MYNPVFWKDEVVEFPYRYTEQQNPNGTIEHTPSPGRTLQEGTPQSETNFGNMDFGIYEDMAFATEFTRLLMLHARKLETVEGVKIPITLKNTSAYPFNGSKQSVQISPQRNSKDYAVDIEVMSVTGGAVGDFEITERMVNGFKIAYTGSATQVQVNLFVRGGI